MNVTELLADLQARHDQAAAQANELRKQIEHVNAFNQHPDQAFRVRELHELLGLPTDDPTMNVTRSRRGRLARQGFLTQPGRGRYQKRI